MAASDARFLAEGAMLQAVRRLSLKYFWRLRRAVDKWQEDDGGLLAASVAYYAVFSILPILLILTSVLGVVLRFSTGAQDAQQRLLEIVSDSVTPDLAQHVARLLAEVRTGALVSGPLGVAALLLAAIGIFAQFERAFDRIWNVKSARRGLWGALRGALWERLRAFLILMGLGLAAAVVFFAGTVLSALQPWLEQLRLGTAAGGFVQAPVMLALDWALFTLIYKALPKAPVRWSAAARGGLLAAVLWELTRQVLAIGLRGSRYGAYGVIGSLIVLMLWIYVASCVIFLGAEYVQVIGEEKQAAATSGSNPRGQD